MTARLSNVFFCAACTILVSLAVYRNWPQPSHPLRNPDVLAIGTTVPNVRGVDWRRSPRTLLLTMATSCPYCERSLPLYESLLRRRTAGGLSFHLIVLSKDNPGAMHESLRSHGIEPDMVLPASDAAYQVRGTQALVVVDSRGRVLASWLGLLLKQNEQGLAALLRAAATR